MSNVALVLALVPCALTRAQSLHFPGTALDPTFGNAGKLTLDLIGGAEISGAVAVQPDRKIIVGGWSDISPGRVGALARLHPDTGTLDRDFGFGGIVAVQVLQEFRAISVLSDGGIVAAGTAWKDGSPGFGVLRLTSNGIVDHSFGDGGIAYVNLLPGLDEPRAIVVAPDGKITLAGIAGFGGGGSPNPVDIGDFGIVRLTPTGQPDPTFGGSGKLTADFRTSSISNTDSATSLILRNDGRLLAGGVASNLQTPNRATNDFALVQYDAAGNLDPTFGTGGRVVTPFTSPDRRAGIHDLVLQPDGKVLAVGAASVIGFSSTPEELVIARYTTDGQLDPTFGRGGIASLPIGSFPRFDAQLLPDGRILVISAEKEFFAALFTPDGQLLRAALTDERGVGRIEEPAAAIALGPDGKIIAAGRYAPDQVPPSGTPEYDVWHAANDITVVRSIEVDRILPDPAAAPLILGALTLLARRRSR
jgi:uncharacterized delta-60 repeat protein